MPYEVVKKGSDWVVRNPETHRIFGRHPSKKKAREQQKALYANSPEVR